MNLIERIKEKKCENQEERFYQYIDNAKYDLKSAINIEEVEFRYVKMLGALDLARAVDLIDTCKQVEMEDEIEDIMKRVRNIIRYEQSPELKNAAEMVNYNMSKQADYFECERKITVYNARTDNIVLEAEGYMSISNNTTNELVITVKTGENSYKKNYVYLNEYTMYAVEDITGTHTDPYHYKLYWHTHEGVSVEVK